MSNFSQARYDGPPHPPIVAVSLPNPGNDASLAALQAVGQNTLSKQINTFAQIRAEQYDHTHFQCLTAVRADIDQAYALKSCREPLGTVGAAKYFGRDLEQKCGFVDLMAKGGPLEGNLDPCMAPPGAILVYAPPPGFWGVICHMPGTRKVTNCGHVEIKTGAVSIGGFASDFHAYTPITNHCGSEPGIGRDNFKLTQVLIPPKVAADTLGAPNSPYAPFVHQQFTQENYLGPDSSGVQ